MSPHNHYGFPLADAGIDSLKQGDLVSWYDDTLYLVLLIAARPQSETMLEVLLLDLCEGNLVETAQSKEWFVGKVVL